MTAITSSVTSLTILAASPPPITSGSVAVVSNNLLTAVDPCNGATSCIYNNGKPYANMVTAWNSGLYSPDLGAYGSLIHWGGGDFDYRGTQVSRFDIATGLWSRLDDPTTAMDGTSYSTDPQFNTVWGEHNDGLGANGGGTPAVPHTYDMIALQPATAAYPSGRIIVPNRFAIYGPGSNSNAHFYDLGARKWSRLASQWYRGTTPIATLGVDQGECCYDSLRNRVWFVAGKGHVDVGWTDIAAGTQNTQENASLFPWGAVMHYLANRDAIIISGGEYNTGVWSLYYMNPAIPSANWLTLNVTGTKPTEYAGLGVCYCSDLDCFFMYQEGADRGDTQTIYKLVPPSGAVTGTWTCTQLTMGGTTVTPIATSNGMYKRLSYATKAKAVMWYSSVTGAVYAYRPEGL